MRFRGREEWGHYAASEEIPQVQLQRISCLSPPSGLLFGPPQETSRSESSGPQKSREQRGNTATREVCCVKPGARRPGLA